MIAGRMADHDVHRSRRIRCQMDCVSKRKGGDNLDWRQSRWSQSRYHPSFLDAHISVNLTVSCRSRSG